MIGIIFLGIIALVSIVATVHATVTDGYGQTRRASSSAQLRR